MKISDIDFSDLNSTQLNQISENALSAFLEKNENKIISKKIVKNFINSFNFELNSKNQDILIQFFKGIVLALYFLKMTKSQVLNQIQTFEIFNKEFNNRSDKLKNDLVRKYPQLEPVISTKFHHLFSAQKEEIEEFQRTIKEVEPFINASVFKNKKGRPNNPIFDKLLFELDIFAEKAHPKEKYAKILIPTLTFIAETYPDILDINEIKDTKLLRQRIIYLKKHPPKV